MNKDYWKSSAEKLRSVKYLALMAVFIGIKTVLSGVFIPVSDNLRISVSFLVTTLEAFIIGPAAGIVSGALTDILGYMLFPTGPFFFGYTITAMSSMLVYALFFYRRQISVLKIIGAKATVNYLINVLMGSLWSAMMYGKAYLYYMTKSLVKNSVLLPVEIIMIIIVFNLMIPFMEKRKLVLPQNTHPIPLRITKN